MLSMPKIKSAEAAEMAEYYEGMTSKEYETLGREDYYENGGEPPGEWLLGAEKIGLVGQVQPGQIGALFQGFHPLTGEALTENAGPDHAPGWDGTFSPPKSVSAIWAIASEDERRRISEFQREAVLDGIKYLEKNACFTRHGHAGREKRPVAESGGLIVAIFEHSTSRNQDFNLHTHALIFNMTADRRAIDVDTNWKLAAGAVYRASMAYKMKSANFSIERDGKFFAVSGVPKSLCDEASSRRDEMLKAAAEAGVSGGKEMEKIALATRGTKGEINRHELFQTWQAQAAEHNFGPEQVQALKGLETPELEKPDAERILGALTQQYSTFSRAQLEAETYTQAQGAMSVAEAAALADEVERQAVALEGGRFTTKEMLEIEQRMVDNAHAMHEARTHEVDPAHIERAIASRTLSDEQQSALRHNTEQGNQLAIIQGWAGTGKTYMLDAAREIWEAQGYTVKGAALAGKAAEGLQDDANIPSQTLHSLAGEIARAKEKREPGPLDSKTVLVIDEAGMVGSRQTAGVLDEARRVGAKVVLVGDSKQLTPIDAGGAFKALGERIGYAEMKDVRRQKSAEDREVARHLREGRAGVALKMLEDKGRLHQADKAQDIQQKAVSNWRKDVAEGKDSIMLAGTRREVRNLNQQARAHMIEDGRVSSVGHRFETVRGAREFAHGDRVVFLRNDRGLGVRNGTLGTVREAGPDGRLTVEVKGKGKKGGRLVEVNTKGEMGYTHIDHGYAATAHKSQGSTVDRAHVIAGGMSGREWSYVAGSRNREEVHFYATADQLKPLEREGKGKDVERGGVENSELARDMSRSSQKSIALDYAKKGEERGQDREQAQGREGGRDTRTHADRQLDQAGIDRRTHEERQLGRLQAGQERESGGNGKSSFDMRKESYSSKDRDMDAELQAAIDRVPEKGKEPDHALDRAQEVDLGR